MWLHWEEEMEGTPTTKALRWKYVLNVLARVRLDFDFEMGSY